MASKGAFQPEAFCDSMFLLESLQTFLTATAMRSWKQNRLDQVGEQNHKRVLVLTYQCTPVLGEWRKYALER